MRGIVLLLALGFFGCSSWGDCPKHLPLAISVERSMYSIGTMQAAASWWNRRLGWEGVRLERGGTVEVFHVDFIEVGNCHDSPGCAVAHIDSSGEIDRCTIFMTPEDSKRAMLILAHEVGHCMGLGHDEERESIMSPFYSADQDVLQEHIDHIESCR